MNEELKKYAKRKVYFLIVAWIGILLLNTILMLVALDCDYDSFSFSISLVTPFLMIFYGLIWWMGVNVEFEKMVKFQIKDDSGNNLTVRDWKG